MRWNNITAGINYWAGFDTMPTSKNEKKDDFKKNYKVKYNDKKNKYVIKNKKYVVN